MKNKNRESEEHFDSTQDIINKKNNIITALLVISYIILFIILLYLIFINKTINNLNQNSNINIPGIILNIKNYYTMLFFIFIFYGLFVFIIHGVNIFY